METLKGDTRTVARTTALQQVPLPREPAFLRPHQTPYHRCDRYRHNRCYRHGPPFIPVSESLRSGSTRPRPGRLARTPGISSSWFWRLPVPGQDAGRPVAGGRWLPGSESASLGRVLRRRKEGGGAPGGPVPLVGAPASVGAPSHLPTAPPPETDTQGANKNHPIHETDTRINKKWR